MKQFNVQMSGPMADPSGLRFDLLLNDMSAGSIRLMHSSDGLMRFYAHGPKGEKLGRVDSHAQAIGLVLQYNTNLPDNVVSLASHDKTGVH